MVEKVEKDTKTSRKVKLLKSLLVARSACSIYTLCSFTLYFNKELASGPLSCPSWDFTPAGVSGRLRQSSSSRLLVALKASFSALWPSVHRLFQSRDKLNGFSDEVKYKYEYSNKMAWFGHSVNSILKSLKKLK